MKALNIIPISANKKYSINSETAMKFGSTCYQKKKPDHLHITCIKQRCSFSMQFSFLSRLLPAHRSMPKRGLHAPCLMQLVLAAWRVYVHISNMSSVAVYELWGCTSRALMCFFGHLEGLKVLLQKRWPIEKIHRWQHLNQPHVLDISTSLTPSRISEQLSMTCSEHTVLMHP